MPVLGDHLMLVRPDEALLPYQVIDFLPIRESIFLYFR